MKKQLFVLLALVLLAAALATGCMNRGNESAVEPTSTPNYMPQGNSATNQPDAMRQSGSNAGSAGNTAGFDWTANAAQIEAKIGQISEISEARVVTTGNTALVGVRFDPAYRGEMTERIREMVAAEVMAADPQITTVAVTADGDDVEDVYELSERSTLGREMDTLKDDINEIVRNATTLR